MELAGFKCCMTELHEHDVNVKEIVTDRHVQIRKELKEMPDIKRSFDVWHDVKGKYGYL